MEYNSLLAYLETKRKWEIHQEKIKSIKPTLNTRNPANTKFKQTQRGQFNRILDVEFENKALLKKLIHCKSKTNPTTLRPLKLYKNKYSLQDQEREIENKELIRRIKNTKASYKTLQYLRDYKSSEKYANLICKYGYKGNKPTRTQVNMEMVNNIEKYANFNKSIGQSKMESQRNTIYEERIIKLEDKEMKVIMVEVEDNIVMEIIKPKMVSTLQVPLHQFNEKFGRDVGRLLGCLRYNRSKQQFYIDDQQY